MYMSVEVFYYLELWLKLNWKRNIFIYIAIMVAAVALFSYLMPTVGEPE